MTGVMDAAVGASWNRVMNDEPIDPALTVQELLSRHAFAAPVLGSHGLDT